ncbi:MAG TPA: FAD-dependent oxidoreductase [bacterium]|nr:FAD-dependent oxidoreductase [bacterium]
MPHAAGPPKTAEVAIVGGGIIGLSIAYHLGRLGVRAAVIERNHVGEGSTAKSSGGIRRLFSTEPALRLAVESVRLWERVEEETGTNIDWHRVGYLLTARSPTHHETLEGAWRLQQRWGVPSAILSPDEVRRLVPTLSADDVRAGLYCANDGYAGPYEAVRAFRAGALRLGATIIEDCDVLGVRLGNGRVRGLETSRGAVEAPTVVNAAGVWAPLVSRMVGVEIPISMYRRHQWIVQTADPPASIPCIIDMDSTLFVRPEGDKYLVGIGGEQPTTTYETTIDPEAFVPVAELIVRRFPSFQSARLVQTYAGLTQETPDRHPVLGPAGPPGYIVAAGFSQGFMHAPAAGNMIAEYIATGICATVSMEPYRLSRFAQRESERNGLAPGDWETH